jgi:hypothetical protein
LAAPAKSCVLAHAMTLTVPKTNRLLSSNATAEVALYGPVKAFLERQGYVVRGELCGCDLIACRGEEEPVIVELKLRFTLSLLLQGVDRLALSPLVYLAVPRPTAGARRVRPDAKPVRRLCRRLGLGLMVISGRGAVEVIEDPVPYRPRQSKRRSTLLLGEFKRRHGDLNVGGSNRRPIVTAYRQDALRCVCALAAAGPMRLGELRVVSGVAGGGTHPATQRLRLVRSCQPWHLRTYPSRRAGDEPFCSGHRRAPRASSGGCRLRRASPLVSRIAGPQGLGDD